MTTRQPFCILGALLLLSPPALFARTNSLTTGLSTAIDYDNPQYESLAADPRTGVTPTKNNNEEDSANFVVRPLLHFRSEGSDGFYELRTAPGLKYDLINSDTGWDADLLFSAAHSLSKSWRLTGSESLLRSDNYEAQSSSTVDQPLSTVDSGATQNAQNTTAPLAADRGRSLYWLNTLKLASEHPYGEDSQILFGFDYRVLRNDESEVRSYEDYDRLEGSVKHQYRFNPLWKIGTDVSLVRGLYDTNDSTTSADGTTTSSATSTPTSNKTALSKDLSEYHLQATVENNTFLHNPLSLSYTYTGSRYDEEEQDDGDIHEMQLSWKREFSKQLSTKLGAGPSYTKIEEQDASWSGNGIAEINYSIHHGSFALSVERGHEVDNFSGSDERGIVDFWNAAFNGDYQLMENLSCNGRLVYRYEDRQSSAAPGAPQVLPADSTGSDQNTYNVDQFTAGVGLRYTFQRYYSANLAYSYVRENSERIGDDYDDHRLVLTLSWQQEWLRW